MLGIIVCSSSTSIHAYYNIGWFIFHINWTWIMGWVLTFCRYVHASTCAGILLSQYIHFSCFSGIGTIGKWYITSSILCNESQDSKCFLTIIYKSQIYIEIVRCCAEQSIIIIYVFKCSTILLGIHIGEREI